jgi:hypothetical protein
MIKKKSISTLLQSLISLSVIAQDIEVKKFGPLEKDQTAVTSPRKDINGNACGLVKVALKETGAEFEGNVVGDVQFTGNEYLVYLPNETKRLGIKHPDSRKVLACKRRKRRATKKSYHRQRILEILCKTSTKCLTAKGVLVVNFFERFLLLCTQNLCFYGNYAC